MGGGSWQFSFLCRIASTFFAQKWDEVNLKWIFALGIRFMELWDMHPKKKPVRVRPQLIPGYTKGQLMYPAYSTQVPRKSLSYPKVHIRNVSFHILWLHRCWDLRLKAFTFSSPNSQNNARQWVGNPGLGRNGIVGCSWPRCRSNGEAAARGRDRLYVPWWGIYSVLDMTDH